MLATLLRTRLTRIATLGTALLSALAAVPLAAAPAVAANPICLSGKLLYDYQAAEEGPSKPTRTKHVRNANIQLWGREKATDPVRRLNSTTWDYTSVYDGSFNLCHTPVTTTTMSSMWVRFDAESTRLWKVVDANGATYTMDSPVQQNISASTSVGDLKPSSQTSRAWHAFDTLNLLWWNRTNPVSACWSAHEPDNSACTELSVKWYPGSTDGPRYGLDNTVYLPDADPDSEHVVLHEGGHFLMHRLYNGAMPPNSTCTPNIIWQASSRPCAWVEGFANATASHLLGDNRYVWANGSSSEYVYGGGWDTGDQVPGNVAGSLLDLWRGVDGGWQGTIKALTANTPATFAEYYKNVRPAANPPLATTGTALDKTAQHTVHYAVTVVGDGKYHGLTNGNNLALRREDPCWVGNTSKTSMRPYDASVPEQRWKLNANADGTVRITDGCPTPRALTSYGEYNSIGAQTIDPADPKQKWTLTQNDSGTLTFTCQATGRVLTTTSSQAGAETTVQQARSTNKTQRWAILP
ncbi:RICIN domain-containing protein [Streptomyces bacillaris]|uniref:RICIN domain-containing protein n=1 Tax=Streptomyces bacillaris TaxID=68179 RepID=UPI00346055C6